MRRFSEELLDQALDRVFDYLETRATPRATERPFREDDHPNIDFG